MVRVIPLLVAFAVVVGALGAVPTPDVAESTSISTVSPVGTTGRSTIDDGSHLTDTEANGTTPDSQRVAPGARFVGVVGVHRAEIDGDVEAREFEIEFAEARTNESKASVVAAHLTTIQNRFGELENRKEALERARETGSLSDGTYRARIAALTARLGTVERLAAASEARARGLPRDALDGQGINVTAIRTLRRNAENAIGPEAAAIARSIVGPRVGASIDRGESSGGPPTDVSTPGNDRANASSDGHSGDVPNAGDRNTADGSSTGGGLAPAVSNSSRGDRGTGSDHAAGPDGADGVNDDGDV